MCEAIEYNASCFYTIKSISKGLIYQQKCACFDVKCCYMLVNLSLEIRSVPKCRIMTLRNYRCINIILCMHIVATVIISTLYINIHTRIVGGQWRHKITILYINGLSVYINIWQIRDVTNRQLFTRGL